MVMPTRKIFPSCIILSFSRVSCNRVLKEPGPGRPAWPGERNIGRLLRLVIANDAKLDFEGKEGTTGWELKAK